MGQQMLRWGHIQFHRGRLANTVVQLEVPGEEAAYWQPERLGHSFYSCIA